VRRPSRGSGRGTPAPACGSPLEGRSIRREPGRETPGPAHIVGILSAPRGVIVLQTNPRDLVPAPQYSTHRKSDVVPE
jgi:hypothetical protein